MKRKKNSGLKHCLPLKGEIISQTGLLKGFINQLLFNFIVVYNMPLSDLLQSCDYCEIVNLSR